MRSKIAQLTTQKSTLEQHISSVDSNWQDEVKETFFSRHIEPLRQSYSSQDSAMKQVTTVLEQAESEIASLM